MAKPARSGSKGRKRGGGGSSIEGDAFLLQASVLVCSCASLGWTVLQIALYGGSEPAMIVAPLMYNVVVYGAIFYERFRLRRSPFKVLVHAHLVAVSILPALLEMESGGFQRSGGVLGWAAVAPFTAMVVLQDRVMQLKYVGLFVTVVVVSIGHEIGWRLDGHQARALFWNHVVDVWDWQIYLYYVATLLGVTTNGVILMKMLNEKSNNAIHAHKMLACSIMPPPVAREVFEAQWTRLREGKLAAKNVSVGMRSRFRSMGIGASAFADRRVGGMGMDGTYGDVGGGQNQSLMRRLLTQVLRAIMGDNGSSDGSRNGSRNSSRTSSVMSFSNVCGLTSNRSDTNSERDSAHDDRASSKISGSVSHGGSDSMGSVDRRSSMDLGNGMGGHGEDGSFHSGNGNQVSLASMEHSGYDVHPSAKDENLDARRVSFEKSSLSPSFSGGNEKRVKSASKTIEPNALRLLRSASLTGSRSKRSHSGVKARNHHDVTVIFVDIVGFSDMCKRVRPIGVLRFLEHYFETVDKVGEEHGVTKIRTVGDGYLAVSGLMADMGVPQDAHRHVLRAMTFGLGVIQEIQDTGLRLPDGKPLVVRVGLAHGPVFSGVVGRTCMQYDIFGDVPNLAARMEQTCPVGGVHMPSSSFDKMRLDLGDELESAFESLKFDTHSQIAIKNMGSVDTVSLTFKGNEEAVERVLAGSIGDDANRAVAAHIGVLAELFRQASWGQVQKTEDEEEEVEDDEDEDESIWVGEDGGGQTILDIREIHQTQQVVVDVRSADLPPSKI